MMNDRGETEQRRLRLDRVLAEVENELNSGRSVNPGEWIERYPDLAPELARRLEAILGGAETVGGQGTIPSPGDEIGGAGTLAAGPNASGAGLDDAFPGVEPKAEMARAPGAGDPITRASETVDVDSNVAPAETALHESGGGTRPGVNAGTPLPSGVRVRYIGDYELLSVLGQGGMGIVYKARQISLKRDVALKMIRNAGFASDDQRRRFQNEAEAVAFLNHPGIVPIYEVGNYEDQHYFSMKLIDGDGLDRRLTAYIENPRGTAGLVAEVAEAVHHAHQRGLLHRDLKPANILVDAGGHPHLTDFGLAKRIEGESGLTVSGAIMGTPAYMAPEQALGKNSLVTTASDVYGLGAILYAMLAGQAPFRGDSVLETLEKVRHDSPKAPSDLNPRLPTDLEVICLKCLEKDPGRRYGSARELADDLRRWLNGEPIRARPVSTTVMAWKWCKRKPALAGLTVALAAALVFGAAGIVLQWREAVFQRNAAIAAKDVAVREAAAARKAEGEARAARDGEQAARTQAELNAQVAGSQASLALNIIQDILSQMQKGLNAPGLIDFKKSLLDSVLKRIDGVANVYDKSSMSKEATVLAAMNGLARIYSELGQSEKSHRTLERCLEIAKERVKIKNGSDPSRQNLANIHRELASSAEQFRRDLKASLAFNVASLEIWTDIYEHPKNDGYMIRKPFVQYFLAEAYTRVGVGRYRVGDVTSARRDFLKAYELRLEIARLRDDPDFKPDAMKQELSYSSIALAETSYRLGNPEEANIHYRDALDQREAMSKREPNNLKVARELAAVNYMIGEFKLKMGKHPEAHKHLEECRSIRERLWNADGRDVTLHRDLGIVLYRLGNLADREKDEKVAKETFEVARKIQEKLVADDPSNDKRLIELMPTLAHVGLVDRASAIADRLNAGPKADNEMRLESARAYAQCARHTPAAQAEKADAFLRKSTATLRLAIDGGFKDYVYMESEPDLDSLDARDDFKALLARITPARK